MSPGIDAPLRCAAPTAGLRRPARAAALVVLMLAGCNVAPIPQRQVLVAGDRRGTVAIEIDRRLYDDKPFEVRLPRGRYRLLTLERTGVVGLPPVVIPAGDPRLVDGSRPIALDLGLHGPWRLRVERADAGWGELTFAAESVDVLERR